MTRTTLSKANANVITVIIPKSSRVWKSENKRTLKPSIRETGHFWPTVQTMKKAFIQGF